MALEKLRNFWERALVPIVEYLSRFSPATITWVALPIGILGGLSVLTASQDDLGASMLLGGGLLITMAMVLDELKVDRKIFLYDPFAGMTQPTKYDKNFSDINANAFDADIFSFITKVSMFLTWFC